jgi:hypothetical protein
VSNLDKNQINASSAGKKKIIALVWDAATSQFQTESTITNTGRGLFMHLRDPQPIKPDAHFVDVSSSWPAFSPWGQNQNVQLDLTYIKKSVRNGIFILLLVECLGFEDVL